jgi:DNA-binding MarR family transcriptional regulator
LKSEDTIDFHIKRTWQSIAKMYNEVAANYGATMATGYVLLNVDVEKGTPSTSLGPKMGMEATSLSRIIKSMEEKNLIYRVKNPLDGRGVLIFLTDFGKEKREDARKAVIQFNEVVFSSLDEEKLTSFFEVMNTVNDLITNKKIYPAKNEKKHS